MTLTEFVNTYTGVQVGDGQCVALIKQYESDVLNLTAQSVGNAVDYYRNFYNEPFLYNNYNLITYTGTEIPMARGHCCVGRTLWGWLWSRCYCLPKYKCK